MSQQSLRTHSPFLVVSGGLLLFLVALVHHGREILVLGEVTGPVVALLVDGLPALGLASAGYWLFESDLAPESRWVACRWCVAGIVLFGVVMGMTLLVRAFEGRIITEPLFPLLVALNAGGVAGLVAGYHQSRVRAKTQQAESVAEAFEFVNSLLRHDLRNDLSVIQGHAGLLDEQLPSERTNGEDTPEIIVDKVDEALTRLETSNAIAETLVGDPDLVRVDVASLATEMATQVESTHRHTVTTDLPEHAFVVANAGLRPVLDNLLENAVEHNDATDPRVHLGVETTADTVRLSVADNGPGIPDEQKAHLFDAYGDYDRSGLVLVGRLVDEYGGHISVEDRDAGGSRFEVDLPRAETDGGSRRRSGSRSSPS